MCTLEEVAEILKVPLEEVRRLIQNGKLNAVVIQGQWMVDREQLDEYINGLLHPGG
jgi:excisionase family DNA binding protein